jgi:hypothetical protein
MREDDHTLFIYRTVEAAAPGPVTAAAQRVAPPDFLWSLVTLATFMRLSLLKAAHAVVPSAAYRKSGSG